MACRNLAGMEYGNELGKLLRTVREARGLTLADIAKAAQCNVSMLSRLESPTGISADMVNRLADAYGLPREVVRRLAKGEER